MYSKEVIWEEEWVKFLGGFVSASCYTYTNFSSLWTSAGPEIFLYEVEYLWTLWYLFAMLHFLSLNTLVEAIYGECREEASLKQVYYATEIECNDFKRILSYSFSDSWHQNKSNHWTSKHIGLVYNSKLYGALWRDMDHVQMLLACMEGNLGSFLEKKTQSRASKSKHSSICK